jgi:starch phosphorylase
MKHLQMYQVFPSVPEPLKFLEDLSRNMWWCWHIDAIELFRRINPHIWRQSGSNPILFSTLIKPERLEELATDGGYLAHMERVKKKFETEIATSAPDNESMDAGAGTIAYFSMEFGIHESLPLFAGGLGVLAGDHLKAASDLSLPLVGMGLLFNKGYFRQFLNDEGWQQEEYPDNDIFYMPLRRVKDHSGNQVSITLAGPQGPIHAIIWKVQVGCVPLYLLDTNIPENPAEVRAITDRLYAGEPRQRLEQEVLLGIGGMRALEVLGIQPKICHMNEGHSAFCSIERLCQIKNQYAIDLETALEIIPRTTIFTTHTPVAAGHDEFPKEMVAPYVVSMQECLGIDTDQIISWGQPGGGDSNVPLSMFVLGLRMSQHHNGVSRLHGRVARRMWSHVWPGWPEDEIPIAHVTNGIHIPSWISIENATLFERYLSPDWYLHTGIKDLSKRVDQIYDDELWQARRMSRARLIRTCRELMVRQYGRRNAPQSTMRDAEGVLDPDILTIGFARRFATYKRATLLLKDPERLKKIINDPDKPVQIIFAGKAHPKDGEGKEIIRQLIAFAKDPEVRQRIVFLEDYDINVTRTLIQGADIWLNTPRRPMEACGTSGMKAAVNGVLNVSVLDGWWCEGFREDRGWAIGNGEEYDDHEYQDMVDSYALYNLLENDVIPCFYDRKNGESPGKWTSMMKASMKMALEHYCTHRMVLEYDRKFYQPALESYRTFTQNDTEKARQMLAQKKRLVDMWKDIQVKEPVREHDGPFRIGESFQISAEISLGEIRPEEVLVELYYGKLRAIDTLLPGMTQAMEVEKELGQGTYLYSCLLPCASSGRFGFTVRVSPKGDDFLRYTPGLITWA